MYSNLLSRLKNLKIKSFLFNITVELLIILLLYSKTTESLGSTNSPFVGRTGATIYISNKSEVISASLSANPPVNNNRTFINVSNTIYDLEYSKHLDNILDTARRQSLEELKNLLIDFYVDTINATSIQITISLPKHVPESRYIQDNGKSYRLMYNISYRLRTTELLLFKMSDHCFRVPMKYHDDVNTCTSLIYYFGHYNDTSEKDYDNILDHCKLQSLLRPSDMTSHSTVVIINNLLPSRYYEFAVSPYLRPVREGPKDIPIVYNATTIKHNCTKEGNPLYAPQSDLGSFDVALPTKSEEDREGHKKRIRRVKLYWRPVPILFQGHNITTYLRCHEHDKEKVFYESTFSREDREFYSFELSSVREMLQDRDYTCQIQSKNSCGYSSDYSIIRVPEQQRIIDTKGAFKIYVAAVVNGDYLVKWTDIQSVSSEVSRTNQKGVYTVYWCKDENCESGIEAMKKFTAENSSCHLQKPVLIQVPGAKLESSGSRKFGVSYRSWKNKNSTGIHWSPCIGRAIYAHMPFEKLATHNISSSWISFNWDVHGGCLALLTLFEEFHINYCKLGSIDPCLAPGTTEGVVENFSYEKNHNCFNLTIKNNLTTDATITNLKPATKYILRLRAVLHGKEENLWSHNLVFRTHPKSKHECNDITPISIAIVCIVVILTCSLFFYCRRSIRHYKSILNLYKRTSVKLPERFEDPWYKNDDSSEVGLRYWLSRDSRGAELQVESSLDVNKLDNENDQIICALVDNFCSDEDNQSDPVNSSIPDYVDPSLMLTSQPTQSNQDNTQDNLTESLSREKDTISDIDEISITSHSSFLENILNDES